MSSISEPSTLSAISTRLAIIDIVNQVGVAADAHQWSTLRDCFADHITVDYSSLIGGGQIQFNADDLIAGWQQGLGQYKATQHLIGNHVVQTNGDTATCMAYVQATHWFPENGNDLTWTVNGYYDYELAFQNNRWVITSSTFRAQMVQGSRRLLELAGVDLECWLFE